MTKLTALELHGAILGPFSSLTQMSPLLSTLTNLQRLDLSRTLAMVGHG